MIPQIRVGGGLVYYYTMQTFKQKLWQQEVSLPATATLPDATAKLGKMTGGALSFDLSLEVDPVQGLPLTLALDYKHKATQGLSGDVTWSNLFPPLAAAPGQSPPRRPRRRTSPSRTPSTSAPPTAWRSRCW